MPSVKWIKITTDMFDNRKIKHLRKLPEGNNIVLIWVMLLTMAGRCNANGMIFLTENIPYTTKMLADELDFEENTIRMALQALEQLDMIIMDENRFSIVGWDEHQSAEGLEKIREQNRLRKQKQRASAKKKLEETEIKQLEEKQADLQEKEKGCHVTSCDSHVTVTQQNKNKNQIKKENQIQNKDLEQDTDQEQVTDQRKSKEKEREKITTTTTTKKSIEISDRDQYKGGGCGGGRDDPEIAELFQAFAYYGFQITGYTRDRLLDLAETYTADWVLKALKCAADQGSKRLTYVEAVLERWQTAGAVDMRSPAEIRNKSSTKNQFLDLIGSFNDDEE